LPLDHKERDQRAAAALECFEAKADAGAQDDASFIVRVTAVVWYLDHTISSSALSPRRIVAAFVVA
jgi:hypothetical protein